MSKCDYCGEENDGFTHKCKFCGREHCSKHLLPENHECEGLEIYKDKNANKWKKTFLDTFSSKFSPSSERYNKKEDKIIKTPYKKEVFEVSNNIKNYFFKKKEKIKSWLNEREYHKYNYGTKLNYLITTILFFAVSIVGFSIFYYDAEKLNQINLWIIHLGGVLILLTLFFVIRFGWKLIKEIINIFKRQKNWLKYIIILFTIFFLWQAYSNKEIILNPVFDMYNNTNFSLFNPINFGNITLNEDDPTKTYNFMDSGKNFVQGIIDPKSQIDISELEQEVHRLINIERGKYGLKSLIWDSQIVEIAREHSQDMAQNDFFEHTNLRGQDSTDRANAVGYSCYKDYGSYYTEGLGENIALTPVYSDVEGCGSTTNLESLAKCIVDGWMTSPGHRENILTSKYTKTGIGIAYNNEDDAYSTQDFC